MIIACDVDNVICNLQEIVIDLFNKRYGSKYTMNDFDAYDVMNCMPVNEAIIMQEMYGEYGLYDLCKPMPGSQIGLEKLINAGHQVYLVTNAVPKNYGEKVEWIKRYFPFIDEAHIVVMRHKWMFRTDIMIEDCVENLLARHTYDRVLMDMPWNRHVKDYVYDIHRCTNWNEIVDVINKINDGE
jgi:5'(3')-deoxyribonucleotidase